ncbi:hypothetical protein DVH24_025779 [Malus domestica]|uniref:Uncharacterized protein n=1 Tax=Malus domestica TaxID=3750 RepID=A0A498KMW4_MALDO|nr:hypothetical protein DVH24_025779 [Malus domestica]
MTSKDVVAELMSDNLQRCFLQMDSNAKTEAQWKEKRKAKGCLEMEWETKAKVEKRGKRRKEEYLILISPDLPLQKQGYDIIPLSVICQKKEKQRERKRRFDSLRGINNFTKENSCATNLPQLKVKDQEELMKEAMTSILRTSLNFYSTIQAYNSHRPFDRFVVSVLQLLVLVMLAQQHAVEGYTLDVDHDVMASKIEVGGCYEITNFRTRLEPKQINQMIVHKRRTNGYVVGRRCKGFSFFVNKDYWFIIFFIDPNISEVNPYKSMFSNCEEALKILPPSSKKPRS